MSLAQIRRLSNAPGLARPFGDCSGEVAFLNLSASFVLKNGSRSGSYFLETAACGVCPGDLQHKENFKCTCTSIIILTLFPLLQYVNQDQSSYWYYYKTNTNFFPPPNNISFPSLRPLKPIF